MALDGQERTGEAIKAFEELLTKAPADSYYEMNGRYEVARLRLKTWLQASTPESINTLEIAAREWTFWLDRDWHKERTKLWGHYHSACAQKELSLHAQDETKRRSAEIAYASSAKSFLAEARAAEGVMKYTIRFTAFFLDSADYEYFPGEPLKCKLQDLLSEFRLR